jgi:hypothetical protein
MELSSQKAKEAKSLGVSVSELVFADLLSLGYAESDAYIVAFPEDMGINMQTVKNNRQRILAKPYFRELCEKRREVNASRLEFSGDAANIDLIDNEMTAREILKIARQMPENSKERGEMFMKYADLTRKNDQKTEEATEAISFYFPLKCHQCPLLSSYNEFVRENRVGKELRPVEMEAIIRKAVPLIRKAQKK